MVPSAVDLRYQSVTKASPIKHYMIPKNQKSIMNFVNRNKSTDKTFKMPQNQFLAQEEIQQNLNPIYRLDDNMVKKVRVK